MPRPTDETPIDLRSYLKVLSRRRWILIATFLTVVLSTALVTWRMTPVYEGEAQVEIQPTTIGSSETSKSLELYTDPTRGLQTQVALAESEGVLEQAATALKLPSTDDLRESLEVELLFDTQVLLIKVQHERPDEAKDWANAVAQAYLDFRRGTASEVSGLQRGELETRIQQVQRRITEIDQESQQNPTAAIGLRAERERALARLNVLEEDLSELPEENTVQRAGGRIITQAQVPEEPVRPRKAINMTLAVVVGSLIGLALVLLAESLDDRLKTPEEIEDRVGAPILGYIPVVKSWSEAGHSNLAIQSAAASGAAEAFRTLRANLRFVSLEKPLRSIIVTSPVAGAGKTTTAANLAATLAMGGSKVVLISADLRRPTIHKIFGLSNATGLVEILDPEFPIGEALQKPEFPNLRLLATGGLPPNPTEILGSERFARILDQLVDVADYVILDAPPVLGLGDTSAMASKVDGILLVLRIGSVTRGEVVHAVDQLRKAGGSVMGCVINAVEPDGGYGYYYNYYSDYEFPTENGSIQSTAATRPGLKRRNARSQAGRQGSIKRSDGPAS